MERNHSIEDYATIEAYADGEPVYAFGYTFIYAVSPELTPSGPLQVGNEAARTRIRPKKTWELDFNYCGYTAGREPKTAWNDDQPFLPVHLIDGDPETVWASRGRSAPGCGPEWIRIDLPRETAVRAVRLVCADHGPHPDPTARVGASLPKHLTVYISRDGKEWTSVYDNPSFSVPYDESVGEPDFSRPWHGQPTEYDSVGTARVTGSPTAEFEAAPAKAIWVVGEGFGYCGTWGQWGPAFSIGQLEVLTSDGTNVALLSRGAGVQVSSTYYGMGMDRFTQDMLFPVHYDLAGSWLRVGYDHGVFLWTFVEREKGQLRVDPKADAALTEAFTNGMKIILCLDKGHWMYKTPPRKEDWRQARIYEVTETYLDPQGWPCDSEEEMNGWLRYVKYMIEHFKDRVEFFEIGNEWDMHLDVEQYLELVHRTIPAIREVHPEARIMLGATSGGWRDKRELLLRSLADGDPPLATQLDGVAWHPHYGWLPESEEYREYPDSVREFQSECDRLGFRGVYSANEWAWMAPYPPTIPHDGWRRVDNLSTELQKAKYAARFMTLQAGLGVISLWNETYMTNRLERDTTLFRNSSYQVDPITPVQPQPVYYALRTCGTILDGFHPADVELRLSADREIEHYEFRNDQGDFLVALWQPGPASDDSSEVLADVELSLPAPSSAAATVVDAMNGLKQTLLFTAEEHSIAFRGVLIRDYPVFVRVNIGRSG